MYNVNDTDISVDITVVDDTGLPVTGLVASTMPTIKFSKGSGADVTITLSDLSLLTSTHSDGGIKERGEGVYRLDLPDTVATTAGATKIRGEATGKRVIARDLIIGGKIESVSGAVGSVTGNVGGNVVGNVNGNLVGSVGSLATQAKADVNAEVDTSLADAGVTSTRQGKLDNIPASTVASQDDVLAINQSASRRIVLFTSFNYEIPSSGSDTYEIELRTNDPDGAAETPSAVTLTASGNSGSYNARISASSNPAVGVTRWTFTVQSTDVSEQVRLRVSATLADATFTASAYPNLTNVDAQDFTSSDRTKLDAVYAKLPSASYLTGTASSNGSGYSTVTTGDIAAQSQVGAAAALTAYDAATGTDVTAVETKVDTANSTLGTISTALSGLVAKFAGITLVKNWLAVIMGKTTDSSTLAEVNATTAGATYNNTTDSNEATRDRGDAAWVTGSGGGLSGSSAVTVTVVDSSATPVTAYRMSVALSGNVLGDIITNASGVATFTTNDGSGYSLQFLPNVNYDTHAEQSFTVSGATAVPVTLVNTSIPASSDAAKVNVAFRVRSEDAAIEGAIIEATLDPNCTINGHLVSSATRKDATDANGLCEMLFYKSTSFTSGTGKYRIRVTSANGLIVYFDQKVEFVTASSSVEFEDIIV